MKAHRDQEDDDQVVFAAKDWQSLTMIALSAIIFATAHFA